ncbi:MAG: hypothetical protein NUW37_10780 [Planctomycetes bacterium]|nr:hypothetical protein [Planctomycetota bacterium]
MSLQGKQVVIIVLSALILICLGWVAFMEKAGHSEKTHRVIVTEKSKSCLTCHNSQGLAGSIDGSSPSLVAHWEGSAHAANGIGCYECHGMPEGGNLKDIDNPRYVIETTWHQEEGGYKTVELAKGADGKPVARPDIWNHEGTDIVANVSPRTCMGCHPTEYRENFNSRHSSASQFIGSLDNFLGQFAEGTAAAASGCRQCHGSEVRMIAEEKWDRSKSNLAPDTWPNTGIGRVNLDGSWGSCSACHSRHAFSAATARRPENCGKCHMGPDHPQAEIYEESKHGIAFRRADGAGLMNIEAPANEWVLGKDYTAAPTCTTCHMGAVQSHGNFSALPVTHDPGARISWTLRPPVSYKPGGITMPGENGETVVILKEPDARRQEMQSACLSCHTQTWVMNFYTQFDEGVKLYNEKFGEPSKEIYDFLVSSEMLDKVPFNEKMDYVYFELWHHEGRRARHGLSMMGPDYTQWHGFYEVAKNFYTEFLPLAEEVAHDRDSASGVNPASAESATMRLRTKVDSVVGRHPEYHSWRSGLSPEQRAQMLEWGQREYEGTGRSSD